MFILIAAALTIAALILLARLPGNKQKSITVEETNGVYDLTAIADMDNNTVILQPGLIYYPDTLLTPQNKDIVKPESTSLYSAARSDYLSQKFVVKLPGEDQVYALTFKLSGRHAMQAYVNGHLVGQSGHPGTTKKDTVVWENNMTCYASSTDGKMEILLACAQFYHFKSGARLSTVSIQPAKSYDGGPKSEIKGLLTIGALLCAAALLLCVYVLLQRTRATLYFSLACLAMALRECIQSQAWVRFSFISGNASFMLEYLSVVLLTIPLSLYLGQYVIGKLLRFIQYAAIIGSTIYGVVVLLTDSVFYTSVLQYYQALLIVCIFPGIIGLFLTMRRPTHEQIAALYGIAVFYLAAVCDIFMYSDLLGNVSENTPISENAMLVFVLAQTLSLFFTSNRLYTEAKDAEQRLAAEKKALENLNRLKTEFLANVSHELKTPLTVISGHAQIARSHLIDQKYDAIRERMTIIASEADRLALMVGQFLDVTRIEEGRMALDKRLCHIDELIYSAVERHFPILNKNGNHLVIKASPTLPLIKIDPSRITQVLVNLIANAIRYTKQGIITVAAQQVGNFLEVSVTDTGTGILPEEISNLFTRYQSHRTGSPETGTGLGLYIVKHIVKEHGGDIIVKSEVGKGTMMSFTLPLQ